MNRFARFFFRPALVIGAGLCTATSVHAGNIQQVTATPNAVSPGQPVQIDVLRGGSGNCGAMVRFGDGEKTDPFGFGANPRVFTHSYATPGSYTVSAQPKRRGNLDPCSGPTRTTVVTVSSGGGGAVLERAPIGPSGLQKKRPQVGKTQDRDFRVAPKIRATEHEPIDELSRIPPQIHGLRFIPQIVDGKAVQAAEHVVAPGGQLEILGEGFGTAGYVSLDGAGIKKLEELQWSGGRIVGVVPEMGGRLGQRASIQVRVVVLGEEDEDTMKSNTVNAEYEIPQEIRMLTMDDPAVQLVSCSGNANVNQCQRIELGSDCGASGADFLPPPSPTPTIYARHFNCWGAVGDDIGVDRFRIRLHNGWKLHELVDAERRKSSDDERIEALEFEAGKSYGDYELNYRVTPNDSVRYWYRMSIVGRMGTKHH